MTEQYETTGWAGEWKKYFFPLTKEGAQEWLDTLRNEWKILAINDRELCAVVKLMANDKDCPRRPTLRDMVFALRRHRAFMEQRRQDFDTPMPICALCGGSGMLQASWQINPFGAVILASVTLEEPFGYILGNGSVPCMCTAGVNHQKQQDCPEAVLRKVQQLHREKAGVEGSKEVFDEF